MKQKSTIFLIYVFFPDTKVYLSKKFVSPLLVSHQITQKNTTNSTISEIINIQMPLNLSQSDCDNVKYICFIVGNSKDIHYTEKTWTNNIKCQNIETLKNCHPGKFLLKFFPRIFHLRRCEKSINKLQTLVPE